MVLRGQEKKQSSRLWCCIFSLLFRDQDNVYELRLVEDPVKPGARERRVI